MIRRLLIACAVVATVERARALAVVEPACEHLAAFEALHPPGRVVAGAHEYYTSLCRGRPLLARVAGGLQLAATNATTRCDAASPCGFDVVGCGAARERVKDVLIVVEFISDTVRAAATARVAGDGLRVDFAPPRPGVYDVSARLQWYNGSCAAHRGGIFLGASESRCSGHCRLPRWIPRCDEASLLANTPPTFFASGPEDSACDQPFWARAAPSAPWVLHENCSARTPPTIDEARKKLANRTFLFVGDSIMRTLYGSFVEMAHGVTIDDPRLKERLKREAPEGAPPGTIVDVANVRARYLQIWFHHELKRLPNLLQAGETALRSRDVVVVANFGLLHANHQACDRTFVETLDEGASIFRAWQNRTGARIRLVLVAAPAVWGLRNPGASWTRFAAFVPLLEEWASRAARSAHGDTDGNADGHADDGQPVFSSIDVLDPAPATLARRDETDDGIHYGRTREEKGLGLVGANAALAAAVYRLVS